MEDKYKHILDLHHKKNPERFSMKYVLECILTNYISVPDAAAKFFANYNSN